MKTDELSQAWQDVETAYNDERINSERALQAILYQSLTAILPTDYLILVEPTLAGYCPDMVIANRRAMKIECVLELKCSPHWWHSENDVRYDLNKLFTYAQLVDSEVEFDIFGPQRVFDPNKSCWVAGRPRYAVHDDLLVGFVDIARKESAVVCRSKMTHPLAKLSSFVLLSGATDPEFQSATFSVQ